MKRKMLIIAITVLVTIGALIYVAVVKPIYSGSVLLEIGEVVNNVNEVNEVNSLSRVKLDNVSDLQVIVSRLYGVTASIPKRTGLLMLTSSGDNRAGLLTNLEQGVNFIMQRHSENAKLYSSKNAQVKMTKIVGKITVGSEPIKPKKKLIVVVAFITGLMLSVFLAFFLEFIQAGRKEEKRSKKT